MTSPRAPAGRPRDAVLDQRIAAAALAVLRVRGPEGVTVEAVAEEAHCGKTSIYRRYRNAGEILAAALADVARSVPPDRLGVSPRQQLVEALERFRGAVEDEIGLRAVASLLYDPTSDFARLMRQQLLAPRLQAVVDLVRGAVHGGELPSTVDPESTVYGLAGSYFARLALVGEVDRDWAHEAVRQLPHG